MIRRLLSALLAAAGLATAPAAMAQSVSPQGAPPSWIAYAESVNREVSARLGGDAPEALRLRAYLWALPGGGEGSSPPLALKLWIDARGVIERIEFGPFLQPPPNDDLRGLLAGDPLSAPPPKDMLQPLRLSVQVQPEPAAAPVPTAP